MLLVSHLPGYGGGLTGALPMSDEHDIITVDEVRSWANDVGAWQRFRENGRAVWFGYDPSTGGPFVAYEGDECPVPKLYHSVPRWRSRPANSTGCLAPAATTSSDPVT